MKRILLLMIFVLVFCFEAFAQERQPIQDYKIDEYGKISWKDEEERLKHLISRELKSHPDHKAVFIFSYKNNSELRLIKLRQKKIVKFFEMNKKSNEYFRFAIGRVAFYGTSIWLVPENVESPN